jgi:hypothetical protein
MHPAEAAMLAEGTEEGKEQLPPGGSSGWIPLLIVSCLQHKRTCIHILGATSEGKLRLHAREQEKRAGKQVSESHSSFVTTSTHVGPYYFSRRRSRSGWRGAAGTGTWRSGRRSPRRITSRPRSPRM